MPVIANAILIDWIADLDGELSKQYSLSFIRGFYFTAIILFIVKNIILI